MADDPLPGARAEPIAAPGERLESWKDIAAYLRRDVRTVQRWEQTDGLPVHRHKRAHRPIPYAYKAELDAWWTGRSESVPSLASDGVRADAARSRMRYAIAGAATLFVVVAMVGAYRIIRSRAASGASSRSALLSDTSIAVLPFLDLSEGMKNEEFADGITEELIDRLSKVRGVHVPAPTATFYFKKRKLPVADIARRLNVVHILDGSVRKSGRRVRVAARLIRPETGYVVWSDTYDRDWDDLLAVQDDIAGEVIKALSGSIDAGPGHAKSQ